METRSERNLTLFGSNPQRSHEARCRSVTTDVERLAPIEGHVRIARPVPAARLATSTWVTRPNRGTTVMPGAAGFDFNAVTDATLLNWLTAKGHRPNVLVECPGGSADTVVRHLMTWCALPFRFSALPGTLELPLTGRGTLLLRDVTTLTLSQQVMLYDWLTDGCGEMQVVSVASAPPERLVEHGEFLEGLLYRLNVIRLDAARGTRPAPLSAWRDSDTLV
jgi:hypothetical protein